MSVVSLFLLAICEHKATRVVDTGQVIMMPHAICEYELFTCPSARALVSGNTFDALLSKTGCTWFSL